MILLPYGTPQFPCLVMPLPEDGVRPPKPVLYWPPPLDVEDVDGDAGAGDWTEVEVEEGGW